MIRRAAIRRVCAFVWITAALIVVVTTALPLVRADAWWIRWFDFPRAQIFLIGVVLAGMRLFRGVRMGRWQAVMFSILVAAVAYQAYRIFPYTPLAGKQVENAAGEQSRVAVRFVTANVLMHNRQAETYLQVLADVNPDIILTTETDHWWADKLNALDPTYPYQVKYPLENTYGMILHSRFPLVNPSVRFLVEPRVPSIHSGVRLPNGQIFYLIGLHPRPPTPTQGEETTERDAELILTARFAKRSDVPIIVLGDLNDVAWSRTTALFQEISGLLDPRIGRGMFNTFHADYFFLRFPLDHLFHSAHFKFIGMRRLPHIGSDHFPLYVALSFEPRRDSNRQPPPPKPEEKEAAEETLEKAFEKKP